MSDFLTKLSSGSVSVDAGFIALIISMILFGVSSSIRLRARHKDNADPKGDVEIIEVIALIMCAISFAILVTAELATNTLMSVAQCIIVILASAVCAAPFIVNFALTLLRRNKA